MSICGIYKIENLINGKIYIGQSVDINYRFKNHKSESFNPKSNAYETAIHRAIRKHGIDKFSFEIIEECNQNELKEREIYWIKYYDSYGKGYNMTHGGEGANTIDKQKIYNLWDKGMSISDISEYTKHEKHSIINILKDYANYSNEESYRRGKITYLRKLGNAIKQYDFNGNFICKFKSPTDASNKTGIRKQNILAALRKEQMSAGGYQWIYDGDEEPGSYKAKSTNTKRYVVQLDDKKQFIKEYESLSSAARSVGLANPSSILVCCKDHTRKSAGFYWMYSEDYYNNDIEISKTS